MERNFQRRESKATSEQGPDAITEVHRSMTETVGESKATTGMDDGSDDDEDDDETLGGDFPQSGKSAATEGDTGEPDKYAKLRREKRLAMNRESARNRRKQKQFLIKSLEEQVAELRKSNQQYQITIESLSSKNRTLENELTMSRIAMAQLSNAASAATSSGITVPPLQQHQQQQQLQQQHQRFSSSLIPHHQQSLQSQHVPTPLEQTQSHLQQQQQQQHQQQLQQLTQFTTIGGGPQNVFDSVFSNPTSSSMAPEGASMSSRENNVNIPVAARYFFPPPNTLPASVPARGSDAGAVDSASTDPQIPPGSRLTSTSATATSGSSTTGIGDNLARLLQAQRDHMSIQRGAAISGSIYSPEPVATPMFTQTWDVPTSMDDSLFGTTNLGPAISNWQNMSPNVIRNIETDAAMRGTLTTTSQSEMTNPLMSNLGIDERQNLGSLDSTFSRSSFDLITRSNTNEGLNSTEASVLEGFSYQQQVLDDLVRQRNIEDFIRYRNGRDHDPHQPPPIPQQAIQPSSQLQQQQLQQQQLQLQIQQQIIQQQQQLQIQPRQRSQSDYDDTNNSDTG